jgi:hypothetical protein
MLTTSHASPPPLLPPPFTLRALLPFLKTNILMPPSYIQMSGMILGSMIEADKRMVAYEHHVRHQRRVRRDMEVWRRYEEEFEARGTPGVGAESNVKGKGSDL